MQKAALLASIPTRKGHNAAHCHSLSAALYDLGDLDGALAYSLKAVDLTLRQERPNSWFVRHLMRILVERSQPALALIFFDNLDSDDVDKYVLCLQCARAFRLLGRNDKARETLEWGLAHAPPEAKGDELKKIKDYLKFISD